MSQLRLLLLVVGGAVTLPPRRLGLGDVHERRDVPALRIQRRAAAPRGGLGGPRQGGPGDPGGSAGIGSVLAGIRLLQVLVVGVGLAVGERLAVRVLQVAGGAEVVGLGLV